MKALVQRGCAAGAALLLAGVCPPGAAVAQSAAEAGAIDVATIVSVPAHEEEPVSTAPRSSFDYQAQASAPVAVPPWDTPQPATPTKSSTVVAAAKEPAPDAGSTIAAFTGTAAPLACQPAGYHTIIDERTELRSGTLCVLPDGSWELLP